MYFTIIPAILILGGALSWVISGDAGLVVGSFTATIIALYTLWDWLFRNAPTRLSTLLGMGLLLGYGVGALNTWITLPRTSFTLGEIFGLGQGALARGIAAVLFSVASLYFLGEIFEKPLFPQNFRLQITEATRSLIYFAAICMLLGYATHSLAIGGAVASAGHVSIPGMFLSWLYAPVTALAVAAFVTAKQWRERLLTGVVSLEFLVMFAVRGRRSALYTTVEILFVLGLAGYRWRGKSIRNVILLGSLGVVIAVCALVFMLLRIAPVIQAGYNSASIAQRAEAANKLVKQGNALALATAATRQNAQTRTFVLAFLSNVLDASFNKTPALGRDALGLMQSTIPSVIDPYKDRFFSEEDLVDQQFGFGYGDQANSILTGGATDFGFAGMILYPLLLVVLARVIYGLASILLKPLPLLIVTLALVQIFMQTEVILSGYFADLRNAIFFGLIIQLFLFFPRLRFGQQQIHPQGRFNV
ncbi:MAG TPA: hypothetical protein VMU92_13335 [Acidobacteriaceae bacterium]|nr:hypothetical protein [Acidobacteriaceae bacterium]